MRWSTSNSGLFIAVAAIGIALSAHDANAAFITQADFANHGFIRYANLFPNPKGNGIGDNTGLGFLNISVSPGVDKFGFFLFAGGEGEPLIANVSFFGTGGFLGSTIVSRGFDGPPPFVGFDNPNGLIAGALINDIFKDSVVIAVDNLTLEGPSPVPAPPALTLFATGLALMGWLAWRKKHCRTLGGDYARHS